MLTLDLCLSLTPTTLDAGMPFANVLSTAWHYRAVETGLVNGTTPSGFATTTAPTAVIQVVRRFSQL